MSGLSDEELSEYKDIFNLVDKDGGGSISHAELAELMDTLGIRATPEEIEAIIREIDVDNNGEIDFDEFVAVMSRKVNATYTATHVKEAFKIFESSTPSGFVYAADVVKALTIYGTEKMTEQLAKELVGQIEADSHGLINYTKYIDMMIGGEEKNCK